MQWYYADAGRQVGPMDDAALDDLVRAGVVRDDTLVWREGMPSWQPHRAARGAPPPPPIPAAPAGAAGSYCTECGRSFPPDQLSMVGNASVCPQCKPIYLQRVGASGAAAGARRYAGFWIRFVARVIDQIILGAVAGVIAIPLGLFPRGIAFGQGDLGANVAGMFAMLGLFTLLSACLSMVYEVFFVSTRGATPGKMALGLKIIRADGSPVSVGLAFGRFFAYLLNTFTFYIGFIIAGFDHQKRALHDHICETRVIYTH